MREGDNTFRPRDHVDECRVTQQVSSLSQQPALPIDGASPCQKREGDETFRPRDTVKDSFIEKKMTVSPQERDETMEEDGRLNDTAEVLSEGACSHRWRLPLSFYLTLLFILAALVVRFAFGLRDAWELPIVLREAAILGIVVCLFIIGYVVIRLAKLVRRFPRIEQIAKEDATNKSMKERDQVRFLHAYLKKAFVNEGSPDDLDCSKYGEKIIKNNKCSQKLEYLRRDIDDYEEWLEEFGVFEKMQDEAAIRCVKKRAIAVFVKTGVSPWKLVDCMAVLYHSLMMTTEMARIYRRRINSYHALRLVIDGLFSIAIASVAQDVLGKTYEEITSKVVTTGSKLVNGILGKMATKVAEGTVNAALIWRLGRHMQLRFRPRIEKSLKEVDNES